jgi:hypothetical protein
MLTVENIINVPGFNKKKCFLQSSNFLNTMGDIRKEQVCIVPA